MFTHAWSPGLYSGLDRLCLSAYGLRLSILTSKLLSLVLRVLRIFSDKVLFVEQTCHYVSRLVYHVVRI